MLDYGFYNMDCIEGMKQFPDNYFDLAIVDPVYGGVTQGGYMQGKGGEYAAKRRDYHLGLWNQEKTGSDYFKELLRVSKNQIVWGGNYFCSNLPESQGWIVWDKENTGSFADCELAWTSFNRATRIFRFMWNGMLQGDMKNKEYRIHPTQKPVRLYEWILQNYANKDDVILDTHVGSASSLIACHNTRHKYVGFEIDKIYYDKAKARVEAETAQTTIFDFMEGLKMRLNQNEINKVTIYFKNGERVEFTNILTANVSSEYHAEWGRNADFEIELMNPICTIYTKRTSKRYKKNRKGYR